MTKKHKFIDTLKSWLVTLGVASVFGLAALGVNAAKSYEKASAYDYQEDGTLVFDFFTYDKELFTNILNSYNSNNDFNTDINGRLTFDDGVYYDFTSINFDYSDFLVTFNAFNPIVLFNPFTYISFDTTSWDVVTNNSGTIAQINYDDEFFVTLYYSQNSFYQYSLNYALSYNAPQSEGSFLTALTDFMQLLGGAIVQLAQPVANGVTEFARDLFIDNNHLSILGGIIGIFAGIALAVGITTKVYTWVTSLGN